MPVSVKDIHTAEYRRVDGWDPDYLIIQGRKVYRTLLIGMILQRQEKDEQVEYVIDDGTASIPVIFTEDTRVHAQGDVVLIIGRPRDLAGRLIMGEIIRSVDAVWKPYWEKRARIALAWQPEASMDEEVEELHPDGEKPMLSEAVSEAPAEVIQAGETVQPEERGEKSETERVYELIRKLDDGLGAPVERVLEEAAKEGISQAERAIRFMLEVGDIFEIRAGRLKVL